MDELRLSVLGRLRIERSIQPLAALNAAKAKALLVYLAVTAQPHSRQALAGLLWPESPEAAARSSLRSVLSQLNEGVGDYLVADRQSVQFGGGAPLWVDVRDFEPACRSLLSQSLPLQENERRQLRAAVHLYGGDFLDDFQVADAPPFEEWVLFRREHYRQLDLAALERLTTDALARSALDEGLEDGRRMLALDSAHEGAHRQLMTLLARGGQRSAALAQFESCCNFLAAELGVEPEPATIALAEAIRSGTFEVEPLAIAPLGKAQPVTVASPDLPAALHRPSFFGREAQALARDSAAFVARETQLAQLSSHLDAACGEEGQVVLVTGQAGSGKSALLREFVSLAQERRPALVVAQGICNFYTGVGEPYLAFREIMSMLCGDVEAQWASGVISRDHAVRLWQLLPETITALTREGAGLIDAFAGGTKLAERAGSHERVAKEDLHKLQEAHARGRAIEQGRLFQEYTAVVQALAASHPLLLIVDDLQWADASSLSMLFHLARRIAHDRILVVVAYRPEDTDLNEDEVSPLRELLNELRRQYGDCVINLDGLGAEEERRFVNALVDAEPNRLDGSFRQALLQQAHGHALFTTELMRDLQERSVLRRDLQGYWVNEQEITWESVPVRVESVVETRLGRLDAELREALIVASVEGEEFTAELVAHIQGIDERAFVRRLARLHRQPALVTAQRVVHTGSQRLSKYRFGHNLFQRYLYSSLDEVERAYLHEAVALELERLYSGQSEVVAVQLAQHFEIAGVLVKAVTYWRQAAESAAKVYANAEAIAAFTRTLTLIKELLALPGQVSGQGAWHSQLSSLYSQLGRSLEIDSQYERALALYRCLM